MKKAYMHNLNKPFPHWNVLDVHPLYFNGGGGWEYNFIYLFYFLPILMYWSHSFH